MNGLSWLIYLSDTVGGVKGVLAIAALATGVGTAVTAIAGAVILDGISGWHDEDREKEARAQSESALRWAKRLLLVCVVSTVASALVPSRNTVLLIGASQAGEQIVQLQEVQELGGDIGGLASDTITLLRQIVSDQIGEAQ